MSKPPYVEQEGGENLLPGGANICRLGVVGRIPGTDTELEPALGIDGNIDVPQAPRMIVLN